MKRLLLLFLSIPFCLLLCNFDTNINSSILHYEVDAKKKQVKFFSKDEKGIYFKNHGTLKKWLSKKEIKLNFAMNGGMYLTNFSPLGLYIENGIKVKKMNTKKTAYGNFYMQPNGVFYLNKDGSGYVCKSTNFKDSSLVNFATQSGPMLVIDGNRHPKFKKGSKNMHIRNGVGILPDGKLLFAMSKQKINFYDFASYFKSKGCKNALYLDGFVSKTYLPSQKWKQEGGSFGIIIAEIE